MGQHAASAKGLGLSSLPEASRACGCPGHGIPGPAAVEVGCLASGDGAGLGAVASRHGPARRVCNDPMPCTGYSTWRVAGHAPEHGWVPCRLWRVLDDARRTPGGGPDGPAPPNPSSPTRTVIPCVGPRTRPAADPKSCEQWGVEWCGRSWGQVEQAPAGRLENRPGRAFSGTGPQPHRSPDRIGPATSREIIIRQIAGDQVWSNPPMHG